MSRKSTLLIVAGIVLIGIFQLVGTKRPQPSEGAAGSAQTTGHRRPFKSAVVELTFGSRTLNQGQEVQSATGRRVEYIDAAGGRRREDYESTVTTMQQSISTEQLTLIFDGTKLYIVRNNNGTRAGSAMDLHEGYDYAVWEDALAEAFPLPGTTISAEQVLERECKVYTRSQGAADIQKWWVWNGVTLRSESHLEAASTVIDTREEAVRVDEDGEIDSRLFSPPTDVPFAPVTETMAQQLSHHKSPPWMRIGPEVAF